VARQWIRHRTANVNEYSARYSVLDREFYLPDREILRLEKAAKQAVPEQQDIFGTLQPTRIVKHTGAQSVTNKQGREELLEADAAAAVLREIGAISSRSFTVYEKLLGDDERPGIARELARMVLPLNTYTQWYWKVDLHNLLHFLRLRNDAHAQYEIRAYAEVLLDIARKWVPLTTAAFEEYRVDGAELSAAALAVIRRVLGGEVVTASTSGLAGTELRQLRALLPGLVSD
jgi:thymidylate synthase (FAD)